MNIYIDESGSINNRLQNTPFVISMVYVHENEKLRRAYKRFVSSNYDRLQELDKDKTDPDTGRIIKHGGKMFLDGNFHELKGAQFDREMKNDFVDFFSRTHYFDVFYIELDNNKISDNFCRNTAGTFNYLIRLSIDQFISEGYLPTEDCHLQLDNVNEKADSKYFLQEYLNTEISLGRALPINFTAGYFDSAENNLIQIADVFSNLFYSHLRTDAYKDTFQKMKSRGILGDIFEFPSERYDTFLRVS